MKGVMRVRVIAGIAKGRSLKAVPGAQTRPKTDKVKEAIFSMIGPYFEGGVALDLFAGTGGLGIEAWSRGAERIIFIDKEQASIAVIRANVQAAGAEADSEIYRNDAERALKALAKRGIRFSLVFLDPPYRVKTMDQLMIALYKQDMLEPGARIVVEHDAKYEYGELDVPFSMLKSVKYGDIAVSIYRFESEESPNRRENDV